MGRDVSRILAIAEPIAAERGLEVLDIEIGGTGGNQLVRVLLDGPDDSRRVGIEDCQAVSDRLGDAMEAHEAVSGQYMLEVSSAGINKPLKKVEHFRRVVGQNVRVRAKMASGERKSWLGRLDEVGDDAITLAADGGTPVTLAFGDIEKANVEFEFGKKPAGGPKQKGRAKAHRDQLRR